MNTREEVEERIIQKFFPYQAWLKQTYELEKQGLLNDTCEWCGNDFRADRRGNCASCGGQRNA